MGVGGGFWEMLRPVAQKEEGLEWLRGKRLAIDLSCWLIQQQAATKGTHVRKPHLRLLFFRTIKLVAKIGAFPIFVVDGEPPPQKLQARLERFSRISGVYLETSIDKASMDGQNIARNNVFVQNIEECVELLNLLGMPVLRAKHEAESLCAELNREGFVDACVTPDSDAFLYGAKCVVKYLQVDFQRPLVEFYQSSDVESILGLHREHLVALALLAGCDYNMQGVPGIGCNNGMRLVRTVPKQDILNQLQEWGEGNFQFPYDDVGAMEEIELIGSQEKRFLHCSYCGHPGTKKLHAKDGCNTCEPTCPVDDNKKVCGKKGPGFKCTCDICIKKYRRKMQQRQDGWRLKLCKKISTTNGFPDKHIIQIYLNYGCSNLADGQQELESLSWQRPQMEGLECFLAHQLHWNQIYIRQKVLPLLSRICLQELASLMKHQFNTISPSKGLINGLYAPHLIERVKVSYSKHLYKVRWKQACEKQEDWLGLKSIQSINRKRTDIDGNLMDVEDMLIDAGMESENGHLFFTTDEDMVLIKAACPKLVMEFEQAQDAKILSKRKSKRKKLQNTLPVKRQRSITSFFKARKNSASCDGMPSDNNEQVVQHEDVLEIQGLGTSEAMPGIVFGDGYLKLNANNCQGMMIIKDVGATPNRSPCVESDRSMKDISLEAERLVAEYLPMGFDSTPDSNIHFLEVTPVVRKYEETKPTSRASVRRCLFDA